MALEHTEKGRSASRKRMSGTSEVDQPNGNNSGNGAVGAGEDKQPSRKHSRYTSAQVEEMETWFKFQRHPDEQEREFLSEKLGLTTLQVKFWFQNRRTQVKVQQERTENVNLRTEIENLRLDNMALLQTINDIKCSTCGGPGILGEVAFKQRRLEIENTILKKEIENLSTLAANGVARPILSLQAKSEQQLLISSPIHGLGSFGEMVILPSSDMHGSFPSMSSGVFTNLEKSLVLEAAKNAMEELKRMTEMEEPLWLKTASPHGSIQVLNVDEYRRSFPRGMGINSSYTNMKREGSRDSLVVAMNGTALVDAFMNVNKWMEMFSSIVTRAQAMVLSPGVAGSRHGSLQVMHAELQVLSPLVSTRRISFIRYTQQINSLWVVVDFSMEILKGNASGFFYGQYRKHPSGCTIQEMPNGYSKVTWVEHGEVEDRMVHRIYAQFINSGLAFGAQRWLATLQRRCEPFKALMNFTDIGAITDKRRNMMKLAQKMTSKFYSNISALSNIPNSSNDGIKITTRKDSKVGQSGGVVICAGTSVRLPVSPQKLFDFLRDEQIRSQCGVLSSGKWEKLASIANGSDPANCISLFNVSYQGNVEEMLQESCRDSYGCVVVCSPINVEALNRQDPSSIPIPPPSGFAILPDHASSTNNSLIRTRILHEAASSSSSGWGSLYSGCSGSLLTIAFQVTETNFSTNIFSNEYVAKIHDIINGNVQSIKAALGCANV